MVIYKSTILIPSRSPVTNIHSVYSRLSPSSICPWTRTGSVSIVPVFPRSCTRGTIVVSIVYHQGAGRRLETERFSGLPSTSSGDYHGFRRSSEVIQSLSFPPIDVQERELGAFPPFPAGSRAPPASRERRGTAAGALAPRGRSTPAGPRRHCVALVSPGTNSSTLRAPGARSPSPDFHQGTQAQHRATSADGRTPGLQAPHPEHGMSAR